MKNVDSVDQWTDRTFCTVWSWSSHLQVGWLVVLGFNTTLTAMVISWRSVTHYVFPGFLTAVLTQLFFSKPSEPPTTFLTCFCRGERRKYSGKKSRPGNRTHNHRSWVRHSHHWATRGRLKAFADDKFSVAKMIISVSHRIENLVG